MNNLNNNYFTRPTEVVDIETEHFKVQLLTYKRKKEKALSYLDEINLDLMDFLENMKFMRQYDILITLEDEKPLFAPKYEKQNTKGFHGYMRHSESDLEPNPYLSSMYLTDNEIRVSMYSTGSLVHEFGHAINYVGKPDENQEYHWLSEYPEFDVIRKPFVEKLMAKIEEDSKKGYSYNQEAIDYTTNPDEVFAVGFNIYYNRTFGKTRLTTRQSRIVEKVMYEVSEDLGNNFYGYFESQIPEIARAYQQQQDEIRKTGMRFIGWDNRKGYAYKNMTTEHVTYKDKYEDLVTVALEASGLNLDEEKALTL